MGPLPTRAPPLLRLLAVHVLGPGISGPICAYKYKAGQGVFCCSHNIILQAALHVTLHSACGSAITAIPQGSRRWVGGSLLQRRLGRLPWALAGGGGFCRL